VCAQLSFCKAGLGGIYERSVPAGPQFVKIADYENQFNGLKANPFLIQILKMGLIDIPRKIVYSSIYQQHIVEPHLLAFNETAWGIMCDAKLTKNKHGFSYGAYIRYPFCHTL